MADEKRHRMCQPDGGGSTCGDDTARYSWNKTGQARTETLSFRRQNRTSYYVRSKRPTTVTTQHLCLKANFTGLLRRTNRSRRFSTGICSGKVNERKGGLPQQKVTLGARSGETSTAAVSYLIRTVHPRFVFGFRAQLLAWALVGDRFHPPAASWRSYLKPGWETASACQRLHVLASLVNLDTHMSMGDSQSHPDISGQASNSLHLLNEFVRSLSSDLEDIREQPQFSEIVRLFYSTSRDEVKRSDLVQSASRPALKKKTAAYHDSRPRRRLLRSEEVTLDASGGPEGSSTSSSALVVTGQESEQATSEADLHEFLQNLDQADLLSPSNLLPDLLDDWFLGGLTGIESPHHTPTVLDASTAHPENVGQAPEEQQSLIYDGLTTAMGEYEVTKPFGSDPTTPETDGTEFGSQPSETTPTADRFSSPQAPIWSPLTVYSADIPLPVLKAPETNLPEALPSTASQDEERHSPEAEETPGSLLPGAEEYTMLDMLAEAIRDIKYLCDNEKTLDGKLSEVLGELRSRLDKSQMRPNTTAWTGSNWCRILAHCDAQSKRKTLFFLASSIAAALSFDEQVKDEIKSGMGGNLTAGRVLDRWLRKSSDDGMLGSEQESQSLPSDSILRIIGRERSTLRIHITRGRKLARMVEKATLGILFSAKIWTWIEMKNQEFDKETGSLDDAVEQMSREFHKPPSVRISLSVPLHEDKKGKIVPKRKPFAAWRKKINGFRDASPAKGDLTYFCPLHIRNDHFTLLEIDEGTRTIYHYDSLASLSTRRNQSRGALVGGVIEEEFKHLKFGYTEVEDSSSCGVMVWHNFKRRIAKTPSGNWEDYVDANQERMEMVQIFRDSVRNGNLRPGPASRKRKIKELGPDAPPRETQGRSKRFKAENEERPE
ncbi:hypothetical protein B0T22DRAFT_534656 [Podospora appendiculata]|uniref:Ubiquitin-like protease family profile domain-containing protein n=1 Tax=Podospora appendiculata TaxID=314037 RepID=A0AAE0X6X6_9PEZI|nr:hypothetical protein B0T22DRAFT_534656 [Podospora appendiculata]